jgi:hypothetical protein
MASLEERDRTYSGFTTGGNARVHAGDNYNRTDSGLLSHALYAVLALLTLKNRSHGQYLQLHAPPATIR